MREGAEEWFDAIDVEQVLDMRDDHEMADAPTEMWALREIAEAAREVLFEHQPERLRLALARLIPLRRPFDASAEVPGGRPE